MSSRPVSLLRSSNPASLPVRMRGGLFSSAAWENRSSSATVFCLCFTVIFRIAVLYVSTALSSELGNRICYGMMPPFRRNQSIITAAKQMRGRYISMSLMAVATSITWPAVLSNDLAEMYHESAVMIDKLASITTSIMLYSCRL